MGLNGFSRIHPTIDIEDSTMFDVDFREFGRGAPVS